MLWELLAARPARALAPIAPRDQTVPLPEPRGRVPGVPDSVDAVLADATDPRPAFDSMAELILAWRAAVGRPEGVVTPLGTATPSRRLGTAPRGASAHRGGSGRGQSVPGVSARSREADAGGLLRSRPCGRCARRRAFARCASSRSSVRRAPGKSSIVHAGLVPRLRRENACLIATMVPGDRPLDALRDALTEVAVMPIRHAPPGAAIAMVAASAARGLVLIVDQFEECWTVSRRRARRVPRRFGGGASSTSARHGARGRRRCGPTSTTVRWNTP